MLGSKKRNKELEERIETLEDTIVILKNYNTVLKRKLKIKEDSMARNQKLIDELTRKLNRKERGIEK